MRDIPVETMVVNEETFGARLRRERERRQIALSSISANTKISVSFFEALERDDLSRWPTGIFRRAFIRAYAGGIGLDPELVSREFYEQFPDPAELPPPAYGEPSATSPSNRPASTRAETVLRLTLADTSAPFARGRLLTDLSSRCLAVGCDAAMILAVAAVMYLVFGSFWMPLGVFALLYELGGILILGNTPGVSLCALTEKRPPQSDPLRQAKSPAARNLLADIRNRAVHAASVDHREDLRV
ncbi:MAG: helix-turn-helix domain-containing protein [Acidobacteriota bacterium]